MCVFFSSIVWYYYNAVYLNSLIYFFTSRSTWWPGWRSTWSPTASRSISGIIVDIVLSTWPLEPDTHRPSPSWWPMELTSPPRYLQQQENVSFFFFHRFSSQFVISHPELVRARSLLNFSSSSSFLILFNIQSRIFFKAFDNISSCVFFFHFSSFIFSFSFFHCFALLLRWLPLGKLFPFLSRSYLTKLSRSSFKAISRWLSRARLANVAETSCWA